VLLDRGAALVLAVDVGHGQLSPALAGRDGLVSIEGLNVRELRAGSLDDRLDGRAIDLVVADLSFISLRLVLGPLASVAASDADLVVLIKPQFEVGRTGIREGVVREPGLRLEAVLGVLDAARDVGLGCVALASSPIVGTHGNIEFLAHLRSQDAPDPTQWIDEAAALAGASG
jgi:23S rRNA (cytidine1920-2'-O)/16S rRNA (cytidine1409-2'-O)-methyltransferase